MESGNGINSEKLRMPKGRETAEGGGGGGEIGGNSSTQLYQDKLLRAGGHICS